MMRAWPWLIQQESRPVWAIELQHCVERVEPFPGFHRVEVVGHIAS
jgi:hypothetical protein